MPKAFKEAIRRGARVRRKTLSGGKYQDTAFLDGKVFYGHVKKKKAPPSGTKRKGN